MAPITLTTNRICADVTTCGSGQYQAVSRTSTTDALCTSLAACGSNQHVSQNPTSTTDRECKTILTALDSVLIALCGLIIICVAMYCGTRMVQRYQKLKTSLQEQEMLLLETEAQRSDAATTIQLMQSAWAVPEEHVTKERQISVGPKHDVWIGRWGNRKVGIAVFKQLRSDTLALHRQCEMLRALRHPNLVIFYGASTDESHAPFLLTEFMDRGSVWDVLHGTGDNLKPLEHVDIAMGVAEGMEYLHR